MSSEMFSYKLSEIGIIITGTTPPTNKSYYWGGEIPFYSPVDINGNVYCVDTERSISLKGLSFGRKIPENSILVTCIGSIGKIAINAVEGLTNQQINTLIPSPQFDFQYVYYLILSNINKLINIAPQTTIPILNKREFGKLTYIFHPLKEQQKIASILQTIDQAIGKTEALIEKYQQIKAGLMHDLFARGITADGKLRPLREQAPELYQETPIGWIPKDWGAIKLEVILLESGGYLQTGPFGSQLHAHEYTYEGVPVVMPQNINNGSIDTEEIARINESRAKTLNRHRLKLGDIIISRRGELNRAAAIKENDVGSICGTGCFLLRLAGSGLDANFFSLIYSHDFIQRQVVGLAVGSTMPSLNNGIMNKLLFPKIDVEEQNRISRRINLIEEKIETLRDYSLKLLKQKQGLMQDLLTGKVPVKVDNEAVHA